MKIVICGGSGFIGKYLTQFLTQSGHQVVVVSRSSKLHNWSHQSLMSTIQHSDAIINLAGRSINCRHTEKNKQQILTSRINTTQAIGRALSAISHPPQLWVNASAIAIYPHNYDKFYDENSAVPVTNFLSSVVQQWEDAFFSFSIPDVRQVAFRTGVVLGHGGAFKPLMLLTKFGLGGTVGAGHQLFSWIHMHDYCRILSYTLQNIKVVGVVNCVSPQPLTNRRLMQSFRQSMHVPFGLPAPAFAVKVGTYLLGTESSLVLDSVGVIPQKLLNLGFTFHFPNIDKAINNLLSNHSNNEQ